MAIPEELNLNFLVGSEIIQICIGKFQLVLNLYPEGSIIIESTVLRRGEAGEEILFWIPVDFSSPFPVGDVLGSKISEIVYENGKVNLHLDSESIFILTPRTDGRESYQIRNKYNDIIV